MQPTSPFHRGILFIMLATMIFCVAACSTSTTSATGGTPSTSSSTTKSGSTSTTVTASTALCGLITLSQVSGVLGATVSSVTGNITTAADGSKAANCTYLPTAGSGVRVDTEISYLFSSNGQAAYASDKSDDASRGEKETAISGLGDAAFWAVSAQFANVLQVTVRKGNILLLMTLMGTSADGSTMLNGAIGLAKTALPSL